MHQGSSSPRVRPTLHLMSILKRTAAVGQSANGERSLFRSARLDQYLGLLRERRERPRRRAAEKRDELASFHSITSSARASNDEGTSTPNVFAVLRLITSSNLVDCTTGRSAGLVPLRIRPA